ncbi:MAG: type VI secretion system baseplate subunit TssK [Rubrivivax sp.]|jgi:type VI secretion system protein ImpJ|nr:type VI secretion system baseplate subunit TssK [Rubrivivax sp.]
MSASASPSQRVVWTEGLFLRPQHFQHQQRHVEWLVQERLASVFEFGWGLRAIEIDEAQLRGGRLALRRAAGVLPDGTPFSAPSPECPLAALPVGADVRERTVHLRAFVQRADVKTVALDEATAAQQMTRYVAAQPEADDEVFGFDGPAELQLGRLRLALVLDDDLDGTMTSLPVARIRERKANGELVLDADFLPPMLDALQHSVVRGWLMELKGAVQQRSRMLAGRLGEGQSKGPADMLLLQLCNRYAPLLDQWCQGVPLHPYALHQELLKFAGECCSFDTALGRVAPAFPAYRHDALQEVLLPPIELIRRTMAHVSELTAVQIPIRLRGNGLYSAEIPDPRMFSTGRFVLGASARVDERRLREALPALVRICEPSRLPELTKALVQGIGLQGLPGTPAEVRWHAHFVYFQLDPRSEHWSPVQTTRQMALLAHGEREVPGLELELWFIRSQP